MDRMGLGYDVIAAVHPRVDLRLDLGVRQHRRHAVPRLARVRVDRRGDVGHLRVQDRPDRPPVTIPVGALGDISSGAVRGDRHPRRAAPPRPHRRRPVRRHRHARRDGRDDRRRHQLLVAWACGPSRARALEVICEGFQRVRRLRRRADRPRAPVRSARRAGRPPRVERRPALRDPRRLGARTSTTVIRPAVEAWASQRTKLEAAQRAHRGGHRGRARATRAADVIADPHVAARNMLVEMPRTDGVAEPTCSSPATR